MDASAAWLTALLAAAEPTLAASIEADAELRAATLRAIERARAAWPELPLEPRLFAAHLGARLPVEELSVATIDGLCVADLWLACACLHELAGAHAELAGRHDVDVRRGLAGVEAPEGMAQEVLLHLLVRGDQRPARLGEYSGRGNLGRWISVVTRRLAIDRLRGRERADATLDDGGIAAAYGDPELALLRGGTRDTFRAALEQAARELEPRERNMLRYHYVHKLALDEIAGIYRVSRSTARRRLVEVRERLTQRVRERMRAELRVDDGQLDRELAELHSAVAVTLSRILR
jgi:RNA polymerase sigma-70 factor, ECF subfamily